MRETVGDPCGFRVFACQALDAAHGLKKRRHGFADINSIFHENAPFEEMFFSLIYDTNWGLKKGKVAIHTAACTPIRPHFIDGRSMGREANGDNREERHEKA